MAVSLFSSSWHRVADLKPRLRSHVTINRHTYRGDVWYVIQDDATGRYHRFTPQAYRLIGLMDGRRKLDDLWHSAGEQLGDEMPSQDEVIQLLSQLYRVDVLQTDVIPDIYEVNKRYRKEKNTKLWAAVKSPMAVKIPLLDPEPFLNASAGISRWIFNPLMGGIWIFAVLWAVMQAVYNWPELTENLSDRVLAVENLFLIWLVYPIVKLIHEFGHAYAVKRWGGEVHEMGLMFLIFIPVPYIDASSSAAFTNKHYRMLVAAAGILIEAFIAALAMWVWVSVEPGIVRTIAFNTLLISGVSTLLFNGNPLLKFDAYYCLSDFIEIPNLAARGTKQVAYLCKKYLFGFADEATSSAYSRSEANWLVGYSVCSFIYRVFITFSIVLFVASELFFVGVCLAMLSLYNMFGKPTVGVVKFLLMDKTVRKKHLRVSIVLTVIMLSIWLILFVIPFPKMTTVQGVVWAPDNSRVMANSDGFLRRLVAQPGREVTTGDVLFESINEDLNARIAQDTGRLRELLARYQAANANNRKNEVNILSQEIKQAKSELQRGVIEQRDLTVYSPDDGRYQLSLPNNPLGSYIPRGTVLGYVLKPGAYQVRVVISQEDVQAVRSDLRNVSVKIAENLSQSVPASLIGQVPSAQKVLPSAALSVNGGGLFALDPAKAEELEAFETVFVLDLQLQGTAAYRIGERVYVRFEHTGEALGYRLYRSLRRLLLDELEF